MFCFRVLRVHHGNRMLWHWRAVLVWNASSCASDANELAFGVNLRQSASPEIGAGCRVAPRRDLLHRSPYFRFPWEAWALRGVPDVRQLRNLVQSSWSHIFTIYHLDSIFQWDSRCPFQFVKQGYIQLFLRGAVGLFVCCMLFARLRRGLLFVVCCSLFVVFCFLSRIAALPEW